jgi:hypothetical protein
MKNPLEDKFLNLIKEANSLINEAPPKPKDKPELPDELEDPNVDKTDTGPDMGGEPDMGAPDMGGGGPDDIAGGPDGAPEGEQPGEEGATEEPTKTVDPKSALNKTEIMDGLEGGKDVTVKYMGKWYYIPVAVYEDEGFLEGETEFTALDKRGNDKKIPYTIVEEIKIVE